MDEFTQYFRGELDAEEDAAFGGQSLKEDLESLILDFSSKMRGCRFFQEEESLFQSMPQDFFQIGTEEGAGEKDVPGIGSPEGPQNGIVDDGLLLTNEISQCMYPREERAEEAIRYIVCYTRNGILCKRAGDRRALWKMPFGRIGDYDRVMRFLKDFEFSENLRFSAHKGFWLDYLSGNLDQEEFLDFFARVEDGISIEPLAVEDGVCVDREVQKYREYLAYHTIAADARLDLADLSEDFLEKPGEEVGWRENYQRWKREFVSLFEEEGKRRVR